MSTVNYSLNHVGVRLIGASEAWIKGKNGKYRLNPDYRFFGKLDATLICPIRCCRRWTRKSRVKKSKETGRVQNARKKMPAKTLSRTKYK